MHRILAAVDLSDSTQSVLKFSADLAHAENANLAVLYAIPKGIPTSALAASWGMSAAVVPEDDKNEASSSLEQLHELVEANGIKDAECLCIRGSAVETIQDAAERIHADLIVTGSHGHGRLFHTVFGSVRETLLAHAPCPVVVVPNHAKSS